jgi:hypothetical protein
LSVQLLSLDPFGSEGERPFPLGAIAIDRVPGSTGRSDLKRQKPQVSGSPSGNAQLRRNEFYRHHGMTCADFDFAKLAVPID